MDTNTRFKNKLFSIKVKSDLQIQLADYILELDKLDKRLKISRRQGLTIENYLFLQIITDVNNIIREENWGIRVPVDLKYSFSEDDSVEILDLLKFLHHQVIKLVNMTIVDYLNLKKFASEFQTELETEFIGKMIPQFFALE